MNKNYRRISKRIQIITFICLITAFIYSSYLGPLLRFINNYIPDDSTTNEPVLNPGDDVLDLDDYLNKITPTPAPPPTPTHDNNPDNTPTKKPDPTTPIIYLPDPKVPGVKHVTGKSIQIEPDSINLLLLGIDAGTNVDSIFIASINENNKTIKLISIPRDAYVPYPQSIVKAINSRQYKFKGIFKVNASYYVGNSIINYQDGKFANKGINFLCSVLDGLLVNTTLNIDDYVRVSFDGFIELVDIAGGVYVNVPEDMYNSSGNLRYAKGRQFLNSTQSLDFVRIRYRFDSTGKQVASLGDPYRKANQLAFLKGCAEQIITVDSVSKAPQILESLSKNVYHSLNSLSKISKYSAIALDYANGKYEMEMLLIQGKSINPLGDNASYVDIFS